jgi:hypothetical protein
MSNSTDKLLVCGRNRTMQAVCTYEWLYVSICMLLVTSVFIVRHFEKLVIIVCLRTWKIYLATCIGKVHLYLETANQRTDKENINLDFARVSYLDPYYCDSRYMAKCNCFKSVCTSSTNESSKVSSNGKSQPCLVFMLILI